MSTKLIRITTEDDSAIFDSQFDEDIVLEEKSQIALLSASFKTSDVIVLNGNNNRIDFQVGNASTIHSAFLTRGTYSVGNITDLLDDFQNKMNQGSVLSNTKEFGLQYQVSINKDHKVEFASIQNQLYSLDSTTSTSETEYKNITQPAGEGTILKCITDPNPVAISLNTARCYAVSPFTKGCGVHRMRIRNMTDNAQNGFVIGLTKNLEALRNGSLRQTDIECGIQLTDRSTRYEVKESSAGSFVPSTKVPNQVVNTGGAAPDGNDAPEIAFDGGVIKMRIHTNEGADSVFELGQYVYDYTTNPDLFPFICLYRDGDEIEVDKCNMNLDPFDVRPNLTFSKTQNHANLQTVKYPDIGSTANYKLNTFHDTMFESLGYASKVLYDKVVKDLSSPVVGIDRTFYLFGAENYIVELLNFPLKSYDSFFDYNSNGSKRGRANIIACIPVNENTGSSSTLGIVQYEANTPHFIGLDNKEQRLFRNIRARVVRDDYTPIESVGLATLTFLLKNN